MRSTSVCAVALVVATLAIRPAHAADLGATATTGAPLSGLTREQLQRFADGKAAFEETEVGADGLGPVFNDTSCVACHSLGGTGGASEVVETRFGTTTDGAFDPMDYLGGSLIQTDGIGLAGACDYVGELVPAEATIVAGRRTTSLFGLGLVDAVPDAAFVALGKLQARYRRATAGRPNLVDSVSAGRKRVGKFGWKGQIASLLDFSADAYLNEMGITTPFFPEENCPQGGCDLLACDPVPGVDDDLEDVELFRDFMQFLAPPPRLPSRLPAVADGSRVFDAVGCVACHVRTLVTGPSPVAPPSCTTGGHARCRRRSSPTTARGARRGRSSRGSPHTDRGPCSRSWGRCEGGLAAAISDAAAARRWCGVAVVPPPLRTSRASGPRRGAPSVSRASGGRSRRA